MLTAQHNSDLLNADQSKKNGVFFFKRVSLGLTKHEPMINHQKGGSTRIRGPTIRSKSTRTPWAHPSLGKYHKDSVQQVKPKKTPQHIQLGA